MRYFNPGVVLRPDKAEAERAFESQDQVRTIIDRAWT